MVLVLGVVLGVLLGAASAAARASTDTGPASPAPREPRLVLEPGLIRKMMEQRENIEYLPCEGPPLALSEQLPPA